MDEAFYSIACDYHLARYLAWPWYINSSSIKEPFEPYFNLWLHGATLRCERRITLLCSYRQLTRDERSSRA